MDEIYLDNNATTPVDPRVSEIVSHCFTEEYGNAGSRTHLWGANAAKIVETAREQISAPINSSVDDVIFTSGATESNNLAILGMMAAAQENNKLHIITSTVEHKAVLEPFKHLETLGFSVTYLPVDHRGFPDPRELESALKPETFLVSTMHANNETGVKSPLSDFSSVLADHDTWWHVDAAQTFGKENDSLSDPRIDLISISGHKMFAPKGVGALIVKRRGYERPPIKPLILGGGQERGFRPGTLPVPLIAGLGLASELAEKEMPQRRDNCLRFREILLNELTPLNPEINGELGMMLPHVINLSFPGLDAEAVLVTLKGIIAISNGSACTSTSYEPSHVLSAMGFSDSRISSALRISWNHETPTPDWGIVVDKLSALS